MGHVKMTKISDAPIFRKIALGSWYTVGDPSVYGLLELDMTNALKFIQEVDVQKKIKITPSHLVGKALGQVLRERPEVNGMIRWGRIYQRSQVDLFYQVNIPGTGADVIKKASLSGAIVKNVDQLSVIEIAQALAEKATHIRNGTDRETGDALKVMKFVPWRLMRYVLNLTSFLNYDLNLNLSWFGIPTDPFGSAMITNVGSLGVEMAWAPLVPYTRVPLLITLGAIKDTPVAIAGQVEVRAVMKLGITFDHRFMDGVHAAAMSKHLKECFENPWKWMGVDLGK